MYYSLENGLTYMFCNSLDDPQDVFQPFKFLWGNGATSGCGFVGGVSAQAVVVLLEGVEEMVKRNGSTGSSTTWSKKDTMRVTQWSL